MGKHFLIAAFVFGAAQLFAEIQLPRIFSDNMLLQREKPVKIWGTADANAKIDVEFAGSKKSATADARGGWSLKLSPLEASATPREMKFYENGKLSKTVANVLVGEVWVLGGQSNMEMTYSWRKINPAPNPKIRYFKNPIALAEKPASDTLPTARWVAADKDNLHAFSMVGYGFAQYLAEKLDIPVGLIYTARGGAKMETYIPFAAMDSSQYLKARRENYAKSLDAWRNGGYQKAKKKYDDLMAAIAKAKAENKTPPKYFSYQKVKPDPVAPNFPLTTPAVHFNGMVAPVAGYAARGVLWYQGESNSRDENFAEQFAVLVDAWRNAWRDESLVWIATEIASFDAKDADWAKTRQRQRQASHALPNSHIVAAIDTGEKRDIHPADKAAISERMALAALGAVYGDKTVAYKSPEFKSAKYSAGTAEVLFETFGGKLAGRGDSRGFELKIGGKWIPAKAAVSGDNAVRVSVESAEIPQGVRYAFKSWIKPDVWLYNQSGLPAFGFSDEK